MRLFPNCVVVRSAGTIGSCARVVFLLVSLVACQSAPVADNFITIQGRTMGTTFTVKVVMPDSLPAQSEPDSLQAAIDSLLRDVNQQMSTYIEDSELSRFNRYRGQDWFAISPDFAQVLQTALDVAKVSGGAFDVTVGPLVNLWGFGPEARPTRIPTGGEIQARRAFTGSDKIAVRLQPAAVKKTQPNVYCDLSAIAKGFGVDKVAGYLERIGIENYMVEIGGEVRTKGHSAEDEQWRIGIEAPDRPSGIQRILAISDVAMATSGDYFNYFEQDGIRYSHTIDPRTGRPIAHKLASVTVIHASCMVADAMATAINVLGPEKGFDFASQQELPIFMIVREKNRFVEKMTPSFKRFLLSEGND